MRERPILFQGAMVRALLAGTKTQTRRAAAAPRAEGCEHCNHPLFAGVRCDRCGRVIEPDAAPRAEAVEARTCKDSLTVAQVATP